MNAVGLCLPGVIPCRELSSACAAMAALRSSLPGRADELDLGNADPAERIAGAGPQAGPPVPAPARAQGDESRQSDPELHEVHAWSSRGSSSTRRRFEHREKLLAMPLKELPAQELQDYGRFALSQADWAARLDNPDWQILLKLKADGIDLLLPDVQQIRALARALQVRFRAEIALGRFDDAIRTAKTMFAMSRHLGEHPTLIGNLVGIAIATMAIGPLEEMLEQPGCPNLYWALTNLPSPLIPLDKGMDGERVMHRVGVPRPGRQRPDERGPAQEVHRAHGQAARIGEEPAKKARRAGVAGRADQGRGGGRRRPPPPRRARPPGGAAAAVPGRPGDPPGREAGIRGALRRRHEDHEPSRSGRSKRWRPRSRRRRSRHCSPMPWCRPCTGVRRAQGRLDQRIALLRHVEALRLYAAEHDGTLPAKLSDDLRAAARRPVHRQAVPLRSRSATRPTSAALRPRARKRIPSSTSITR